MLELMKPLRKLEQTSVCFNGAKSKILGTTFCLTKCKVTETTFPPNTELQCPGYHTFPNAFSLAHLIRNHKYLQIDSLVQIKALTLDAVPIH
jgi:hypothetical protein